MRAAAGSGAGTYVSAARSRVERVCRLYDEPQLTRLIIKHNEHTQTVAARSCNIMSMNDKRTVNTK